MTYPRVWIPAILASFYFFSACGGSEHAPDVRSIPARAPADSADAEQFLEATGRIDTITPNRRHAVIAHGDIPGFMNAMTMPFRLADTSLVSGFVAGDSVLFTVRVSGPVIEITEMSRAP